MPSDHPTQPIGNLVLTGFMGTGKSTVGRLLAGRLGRHFVDTDDLIEERHGPIPAIFADQGEDVFRRLETDVAIELGGHDDLVVATGGGLLLRSANVDALGATGHIVCLTATPDTLVDRLAGTGVTRRPLLAGRDLRTRLVELLAEREPTYRRFVRVPTDELSPAEIAEAVLALVNEAAASGEV